ncbi:alcohol dehydrogenase catalytic domain-containing protein [Cylindrospermopsis raciborskii CHAB3438]|jgi:L-iditol 2-dehydrogenase|uniref:zinc-dependent dehydrogenase n=1 Tax=Cylindrospermopsis raciborskii TaxID=77022 RepID=UPI000E1EB0B8|nr:zinc-dependent dehydrogenase [Cylindrospermopsis raciborskii]MCH4903921.1 alcohol dehydrogenase catalytic domain-containing protein [Cylindrospermopsis raciborskii CHAB3438]MEB3147240.1 zinc-dependent dehydrogenase [Cylindrospermopsis raciborskii]TPX29199.1 zinc-binding dehydrogenase [Cylindrospermopsis raciborskii GIHE 2018]UJL32357.1 zinc-dependent dehydrogenase [Cylindrospermopsis raciborskii Cr2010]UJS04795.1 zinc-dependent dehydrogenase [Cylindrospermopsis raciborskii KLL07]
MKAQVFRGVNQLSYEEVPVPHLAPEEVLVQVRVVGLCQSDIKKIRYPLYEPPRIFGHETAGTIAAVGSQVNGWQVGDRVAVMHHIPCMRCAYCLNENFSVCDVYKNISTTAGFNPSGGGFAEYVKVPGHIVENGGLIPIPDHISFEEASFVEPTNCCLKAVKKAQIAPGQTVLITGAGPIGLMFIMLVQYFGARAIATDLLPSRIEKAMEIGAEAAFDARDPDLAKKVQDLTGGIGADVALLAVPSDKAFFQALNSTRKGGKILFFAEFPDEVEIPINPNILYRREIDLIGSYSSSYRLQSLAADIVFRRRINVQALISDRYPLENLHQAVEQAIAPTAETYKILIYP